MKLEIPEAVSQKTVSLEVEEIEPILQAPAMNLPPWPDAYIPLKDGRILYVREARREEAKMMLAYMKCIMDVERDFYDIVGVRVCAEIMGWYRHRMKDPYVLVGLIDGMWAGFCNGRVMNERINVSHHTVALVRGGRVGAAMYYVKAYYAFEMLGAEEFWSTPESYNGWMRYIVGMAQNSYPWPQHQHELGGGRIYYITKNDWQATAKAYTRQMLGSDLIFDVPDEIRKRNEVFRVPDEIMV